MEAILNSPFIVPLGAFALAAIIVGFTVWGRTRQRELQIQHDLRLQQMEHERKMKELEIEKIKASKGTDA